MLAAIFISSGLQSLFEPERLADTAKPVTDPLAPALNTLDPRLPTDPQSLVQLNAAVQFGGGVMLATGIATAPVALLLAGSLVPTTIAGHPFWKAKDKGERTQQQIHFLKNLGLFGGLIFVALDSLPRIRGS
jgi:putative oxidoreductase